MSIEGVPVVIHSTLIMHLTETASRGKTFRWQANILFLNKSIMLHFYFMGPLTHLCEPSLSKICSHITSSQLLISELFKSILNVFVWKHLLTMPKVNPLIAQKSLSSIDADKSHMIQKILKFYQ